MSIKERMRFFIKWTLGGAIQRALIAGFAAAPNREGWEDRVLIVNLHGIGDIILGTPALRYYRRYFRGKRIFMLVPDTAGFSDGAMGRDVDVVLRTDVRRFSLDPRYALREVNRLRGIGFGTVIDDCVSIRSAASGEIAVALGSPRVVGYEGIGIEYADPAAAAYHRFAERHFLSRCTTRVPSLDKDFKEKGMAPRSAILHHFAICAAVTGERECADASTVFEIDPADVAAARTALRAFGLQETPYAAFVLGANDPIRRWPPERFAKVAEEASRNGLQIVLLGAPSERPLVAAFAAATQVPYIDAVGRMSLMESAAAIKDAYCLISNDTGPVHIAIALGTPSLCIAGGAHIGTNSLYGRKGMNRWVYKDIGCLYDDWRCAARQIRGMAPCIDAVSADDGVEGFRDLFRTIRGSDARRSGFMASYTI